MTARTPATTLAPMPKWAEGSLIVSLKKHGDRFPSDDGKSAEQASYEADGLVAEDEARAVDQLLRAVLESAETFHTLIPDAVGAHAQTSAAQGTLTRSDGDVLRELHDRFEIVLGALGSDGDWVTNETFPGKLDLSESGGVDSGVRQLIRKGPLETAKEVLPSGDTIAVPSIDEGIRIVAVSMVKRNQARGYLDIVAMSEGCGVEKTARVLSAVDTFYADERLNGIPVATQIARQLADPHPSDRGNLGPPETTKGLGRRRFEWGFVVAQCQSIAAHMLDEGQGQVTESSLRFRNIGVKPSDPVEVWGAEGVLAALERGDLGDWCRIVAAVRRDPGGHVAEELHDALECADAPGAVAVLSLMLR